MALLALVLLAALTAASPAAAAKSCGNKVINDWYDNGRVDGTYPLHCYDDAIESLPRDVEEYSSAKEDIERALQARLRGKPAPPATTDPTPGDGNGPAAPVKKTKKTTKTDTTPTPGAGGPGKPGDPGPEAGPVVDTASADAVPIPLLVLAALALLLVAAGSAGYVVRRVQTRRVQPPLA